MVIEGKKNLTLVKKGLLSYMKDCTMAIKRSPKDVVTAIFELEFDSINELLGAVETNLSRLKTEEKN